MSARRRELWVGVAALLGVASVISESLAAPPDDGARWWAHIQVLASDSLRGRMTGTPDYVAAARYVASRLRAEGVRPAGTDPQAADADAAYFQSVPFVWRKLREPECALALVRDGVATPLELGKDATLSTRVEAADTLDAPLMFVGYGVSVPEAGYDDLAGLDLTGKIAVYVRAGPDTLPPALRAHAQSLDIRWSALRAHGAVGYATVSITGVREGQWERFAKQRFQPGLALADVALDDTPGARFAMRVNPAHFDRLLEGSGHTVAELTALADSGRRLPVFPLASSLRARVRFDRKLVDSPNVVGLVTGSDPALRDEYVVVSAHLDHLGVGAPVEGDSIFNGAMDNASGVASLLEFARYARAADSPFRRSVILLAVTGEEVGLCGSRFFAAYPTVSLSAIVADVNLDMFLPIVPFKAITVYGLNESDLGDRFTAIARQAGVAALDDPEPRQNIFIRSDQYSFIRRGVPSLFFEIGAAAEDTTSRGVLRRWNRRRYHQVGDDLNQPIDLEVAAAFTHLLYDFTRDVANQNAEPRWKQDSFFRRFAAPGSAALGDTTRSGRRDHAARSGR